VRTGTLRTTDRRAVARKQARIRKRQPKVTAKYIRQTL
jgi:hypothetical protein